MYILNIPRAIKKTSVNEIRSFIFEIIKKELDFSKENSYYSMKPSKKKDLLLFASKLIEEIPDRHNLKHQYQ